jgi:hypothetical protein
MVPLVRWRRSRRDGWWAAQLVRWWRAGAGGTPAIQVLVVQFAGRHPEVAVFGMRGLTSWRRRAQGNVITSSTGNVRLDRGTRMLLVTGDAGAAASAAGSAGATAIPAPR